MWGGWRGDAAQVIRRGARSGFFGRQNRNKAPAGERPCAMNEAACASAAPCSASRPRGLCRRPAAALPGAGARSSAAAAVCAPCFGAVEGTREREPLVRPAPMAVPRRAPGHRWIRAAGVAPLPHTRTYGLHRNFGHARQRCPRTCAGSAADPREAAPCRGEAPRGPGLASSRAAAGRVGPRARWYLAQSEENFRREVQPVSDGASWSCLRCLVVVARKTCKSPPRSTS